MATDALIAQGPFAALPATVGHGAGVMASVRDDLAVAMVLARKGKRADLARTVRKDFDIELPDGPALTCAEGLSLLGIGPGAWLAISEHAGHGFARSLAQRLSSLASISDQSDGLAVLRLAGPMARETLAKLVPVDLHPRAFGIGAVAVTVAAHIGITLWRLPDRNDVCAVFQLAVPRSFASSLSHALAASAAEFGLILTTN